MNKNIKYLIEDIVNFNPVDYSDEESDIINTHTITTLSYKYFPQNKEELVDIVRKKIDENKFGNESLLFPDLYDIDISNITDLSNLFIIVNLPNYPIKLDLHTWNVSNVTNMESMFNGCKMLLKLNLSGWNTSSLTNMDRMFYFCE